MKWLIRVTVPILVIAVGTWWLLLDGTAPKTADNGFEIAEYRQLVAAGADDLPKEIRIEQVGSDLAPGFAAEVGNFSADYATTYTSFQIVWPDQTIVIGGAIDAETSKEMEQSEDDRKFDGEAYGRVTAAMISTEKVLITHEHLDHVMAVARHPEPAQLAPRLHLNAAQLAGLSQFAKGGILPSEIAGVATEDFEKATLIAPGLVLIPTPGHTAGSRSFFVTLENGAEYLLIGDIVWKMSNIENLKTRPRLLQYILFDPQENRSRVLEQVRALHDLKKSNPNLIILPSHDKIYLDSLVKAGTLQSKFNIEPPLTSPQQEPSP